ncbi:hypothetical protein C5167_002361 [Papaver somniferum]|uniref:Uncharacterized protein n=1 Tax=Papaver somniferum TaxID=3469 RepID=A0A4Y7L0I1_PAPSO|nr:hypothetical protein C5167_002361 [Papaver somniferum]
MSAEIGSTRIVSGYGCARKETMSSIDLGKKRAGICSENIRQPRRRFTEANSKKDVLSMFIEARNIFCQKKLDGNKRSYSREEMEALRFENSYQQRQIWREIYTGLGPVYHSSMCVKTLTDPPLLTTLLQCQMLVADFLSQLIIFVSQITNSKPNNFSPVNCLTATSLPDATTVTD